MPLPLVFSLPDLINGSPEPDYRLSDATPFFYLYSTPGSGVFVQEPIGWDAAEWVIERDLDWHGLNFEFAGDEATLKFQQDIAIKAIEDTYAQYGPNGNMFLTWGLTDATGDLPLQTLRLKLEKRSLVGGELTIPGERFTLHADIRDKWDTTLSMDARQALINDVNLVPIAITPPAPATVVLHSQRIKQTTLVPNIETSQDTDWKSFQNTGANILEGGGLGDLGAGYNVFNTFYLSFPLDQARAAPNEVKKFAGSSLGIITEKPEESSAQILLTEVPGSYKIDINLDFQVDARLQKRAISIDPPKIRHYDLLSYLVIGTEKILIGTAKAGNPNSRFMGAVYYRVSYSGVHQITKNTPVYIYGVLGVIPDRGNWKGTDVRLLCSLSSLSIVANTYAPASTAPAYPIIDILRHFVACLTGRPNAVQSAYYSLANGSQPVDGGGSHRLQTNGYYLRGFPGKPVQNSLQDELTSLQAIDAIGISYKPTVDGDILVVEPIAYWYRDVEVLTLDSYTIIEEDTASEYLHPTVEVGYNKFPGEGEQVLDDFNTKHEYSLPMRAGKTYKALSDLIASGYAIEQTRRVQFTDKPTDSTTYDDDNFIICTSQLIALTPEQSATTLSVTFQMVSGKANMSIELADKPAWFSKGITFLVSGSGPNAGLYKVVDQVDAHIFGVNKALAVLDRPITSETRVVTISISQSGSFQAERDEDFDKVSGVVDPSTTYNIRLSPRFNLLRHAPYIAGGLAYSSGSEPVRCTFSKNNGTLRTKLKDSASGDLNIDIRHLIQHNDDTSVAALRAIVPAPWRPERVKIKTKLTIDQMLYLRAQFQGTHPDDSKHYGYIKLNNETTPVRGFPLTISFKPATGETTITLLKKRVSLSEEQGSTGCDFYRDFTFADFEALPAGSLPSWIEGCTFDNFS